MAAVTDCVFCKIAAGEIPAELVADEERVVAFRDLNPQAPTHVLVIPRQHHENVGELASDPAAMADLVATAARIAAAECDGEYRLVFNTGAAAGQSVFHVHGHVLGGRGMAWPPG
jgi:histidine triad (HIT) family protein